MHTWLDAFSPNEDMGRDRFWEWPGFKTGVGICPPFVDAFDPADSGNMTVPPDDAVDKMRAFATRFWNTKGEGRKAQLLKSPGNDAEGKKLINRWLTPYYARIKINKIIDSVLCIEDIYLMSKTPMVRRGRLAFHMFGLPSVCTSCRR